MENAAIMPAHHALDASPHEPRLRRGLADMIIEVSPTG